jgi:sugar lactone lactonase YvrE
VTTASPVIGSAARSAKRRAASDPDPIHAGRPKPLGPVSGYGGINISGPYEPAEGWPKIITPGWRTGSARGVFADSPDRIVAVYGGELPAFEQSGVWGSHVFRDLRFTETNHPDGRHRSEVVVYDREGNPVEVWDHWLDALHEQDRLDGRTPNMGHVNRIKVSRYDPERHIWLVGTRNTGIFKITNDGRDLALKIDASMVPAALHPTYYVQEVAFLPDGDLLVGHWHGVMRFSPDGEFRAAFGVPGSGRMEFDGLHDIVVHPHTGLLYINDRLNSRIVVASPDAEFIEEWPNIQGAYSLRMTADGQYLWVGNGLMHKFVKYDLTGRLVRAATWGTFGIAPGAFWSPHYFDCDDEGNLYVAEDYLGRLQKFRPMADADRDDPQLVGPLVR